MKQPISVLTNGRMSNVFGGEPIDIESIQQKAIWKYLSKVLPRLTPEDIAIFPNATQRHRVPHRYKPENKGQIPQRL
jgi:S-adenosylmethionine synthetase